MSTVYIPTKANQDAANTKLATVEAKIDAMEQTMASASTCTVRVHFNATGQTYDVPAAGTTSYAEVLNGAKIILREQGIDHDYEAQITTLTNFTATFTVFVTQAARGNLNTIGAVLGHTATAGYTVAASQILFAGGNTYDIYINSRLVTGSVVELCRVQPFIANPSASSDNRLKYGNSYLGTRITTAGGTTLNLGHWTEGQGSWVDQSLTKISLWNCPSDGSTPTERVITTAADTTGWETIENRLNCLKNIIIGTLTFTGDSATIGDNRIVRYDPLWIKQTRETINMPIADSDGNLVDNYVDCIVRWYANTQVDAAYHLHPLFEKYTRNADGTYTATPCAHGYIARYPCGNSTSLAIGGVNETVCQFKSGSGREYAPGNRSVALGIARKLNRCTVKLFFDDDGDGTEELFATISPDTTNRTFGVSGTAEISFIQWMSYLYFGVNVQGSASTTDKTQNIFPGICTSSVDATLNGATDHIVNPANHVTWGHKVWNGAVNTQLCTNSIVFLGVEDALWSSTGWYWEDVTLVTRRTITTDATGAITSNAASTGWLFAQDAADVNPGSVAISNETTECEAASFEGQLKAAGYRATTFNGLDSGAYWYRAGIDTTGVLRDACLPAPDANQSGLNCGACDNFWRGSTPGDFGNFAATTNYAVGDYVKYNSLLYKCISTHSAGAWDPTHFEPCTSKTITRRSYWMVCLGHNRAYGVDLGSFSVYSDTSLSYSLGRHWRPRPFLRTVS